MGAPLQPFTGHDPSSPFPRLKLAQLEQNLCILHHFLLASLPFRFSEEHVYMLPSHSSVMSFGSVLHPTPRHRSGCGRNHYFFTFLSELVSGSMKLSNNYFGCCGCGCGWGYLLWGLLRLRPSFASKAVVDEDILETTVGGWRRSGGDTFLERIQRQKLL